MKDGSNEIIVGGDKVPFGFRARVRNAAALILSALELRRASVEIFLVGGAGIRNLKKKFALDPAGYADVLAFPASDDFPHPEIGGRYLGEIYLNKTIAARDPRRGVFLLIHGILHLLGYDHKKKGDMLKMEKVEQGLLGKLPI